MGKLNRREFVAFAAAAPATLEQRQFAYVGTSSEIVLFAMAPQASWIAIQKVPSCCPAFLQFNRSSSSLFVANAVDVHERSPRSTVESYDVHPFTGKLKLRSRQMLSLSAVGARHLALTPDERYLVVSASGGGAYNVLSVSPEGSLSPPVHILKETGCSTHPELQSCAHPHSLAYHPAGHYLLASDLGSDRLSVFNVSAGKLRRSSSCLVQAGDGPGTLSFTGNGSGFVVLNRLSGSLSLRSFDLSSGSIGAEVSRRPVDGSSLLVAGEYAYVGGSYGVASWRIAQNELQPDGRLYTCVNASESLVLTPDAKAIVSLGQKGVYRWPVDRRSGALLHPSQVAAIEDPLTIAFKA